MQLRYIAGYKGTSGLTGKIYEPNQVYEEPDEVAAQLLASGQFEKVVEKKTPVEVNNNG